MGYENEERMSRGAAAALIENVTRIVIDVMFVQQRDELGFKRMFCVVLSLPRNVFEHLRFGRFANAECTVAFLPMEPPRLVPQPPRRVRLQRSNAARQGDRCWQGVQQVAMIFDTTASEDLEPLVMPNADEILAQGFFHLTSNEVLTVLGAKDEMDEVVVIRV